ncbi:hypothetical protein, conserved [Eimeria tenella]|uniref:Uncharacterized protein n=1 Tax=Eimeria tenella TaxID=5802 RepID=U6KGZ6_EIMTE|nr:hypothetical protein, conserved [Eimeria tenella]CDJ37224.1 hypothetical protein, conserved [Eimeria tenella]|eukprot:XP_013228062.1 hypothetical protein, conserved [Eimeria tenella]
MKKCVGQSQGDTTAATGPPDACFSPIPCSGSAAGSGSSSSSRQQQGYLEAGTAPSLSEYRTAAFAALSGLVNSALAAGGAAAATAAAVPQRLASLAASAGQSAASEPDLHPEESQQQQEQQQHIDFAAPLPWRCPFHDSGRRQRSPAAAATAAAGGLPRGRHFQRVSGPAAGSRNRSSSRRGPQRRHRISGWRACHSRPYSRPRQQQQQQQQQGSGLWFSDFSLNFVCPLCLAASISAAARGRAVEGVDACLGALQQEQQQQQQQQLQLLQQNSSVSDESECVASAAEGTPLQPHSGPSSAGFALQQEKEQQQQQQQQRLLESQLYCSEARDVQQQRQRRHRALDVIISALLPRSLGSKDPPRAAGVATAATAAAAAAEADTPSSRRVHFVSSLPSRALALAGAAAAAASAAAAAAAAAAPATLRRRQSSSSSSSSSSSCLVESSDSPHYAEYLAFHVEKWREGSFDRLEVDTDDLLVDPLQARCTIM